MWSLTKGSILIRGAQIEVRQDAEGYQYGRGDRCSRQARRSSGRSAMDLDEFIEGEGDTIEYDGKADTVRFIKKAQIAPSSRRCERWPTRSPVRVHRV